MKEQGRHTLQYWSNAALAILLFLFVSATIVWHGANRASVHQVDSPALTFFGKVIDQGGRPVVDVAVEGKTFELTSNPIMSGTLPNSATTKTFRVLTDVSGDFRVELPLTHYGLEIIAVNKDGYEWVKDWAWHVEPSGHTTANNYFQFRGKLAQVNVYEPDITRPAIMPVYEVGSDVPSTQASRGGSDVLKDGSRLLNEPYRLRIPSAGPDAPKTRSEIDARIKMYLAGNRNVNLRDAPTSRP